MAWRSFSFQVMEAYPQWISPGAGEIGVSKYDKSLGGYRGPAAYRFFNGRENAALAAVTALIPRRNSRRSTRCCMTVSPGCCLNKKHRIAVRERRQFCDS